MPLQIDSITPTAINAIEGDQITMSCEASGGDVFSAFSLSYDSVGASCFAIYYCDVTDRFLAGFGYSPPSIGIQSSPRGDIGTWNELYNLQVDGVFAICSNASGGVLVGSVGALTTKPSVGVYLDGVLKKTFTNTTQAYPQITSIDRMANGNIIAISNVSPYCSMSSDGGETWSDISGLTFTESTLTISTKTALLVATTAGLFRVTETGGVTKLNSTSYLSKTLFRLSSDKICVASYGTPANWLQSTDNGITWQTYTGAYPTDKRVYLCKTYDYETGRCIIGHDYLSSTVDGGASWRNLPLPSGYNRAYGGAISSGQILTGLGYGAGDGDIFKVVTDVQKTLRDTSDNSVISTVSPYQYTADLADNGHDFQWTVTDGVSTVQSVLIPVTVNPPVTPGAHGIITNVSINLGEKPTVTITAEIAGAMVRERTIISESGSRANKIRMTGNRETIYREKGVL